MLASTSWRTCGLQVDTEGNVSEFIPEPNSATLDFTSVYGVSLSHHLLVDDLHFLASSEFIEFLKPLDVFLESKFNSSQDRYYTGWEAWLPELWKVMGLPQMPLSQENSPSPYTYFYTLNWP